ncbi:hypothetical protein ColTof4_04427 [Colletotrichum tofieldiae]|nr:hypothetical protein ColTof3_11364 [Colletotrichum tofieldiae]GKT72004.1 hypothetical protein ColTof4_04427 [Colletotrichum tofieldiae]
MGHIGYPTAVETVAAAWRHENVYIDTSACSPKNYTQTFITFVNKTGKSKVMFATNFPQLGFKECVKYDKCHLMGTKGRLKEDLSRGFMGEHVIRFLKLPLTGSRLSEANL